MKKKGIHPILLAGGVLVILIGLAIFVPAILGSVSGSSDLEKYNGTSDQGNQTVRIAHSIDSFFVGMFDVPLFLGTLLISIFIIILAMLYLSKSGGK